MFCQIGILLSYIHRKSIEFKAKEYQYDKLLSILIQTLVPYPNHRNKAKAAQNWATLYKRTVQVPILLLELTKLLFLKCVFSMITSPRYEHTI